MNDYQREQSKKILSCYLEKGGRGSGRKKRNSIPELEESNFSPDIENQHRKEADEIFNEEEGEKRKLYIEVQQLGDKIRKLRKQIEGFESKKVSLARSNMTRTQEYYKTEGIIKKLGKEGRELIAQYREKQKQYNEFNQ